MIYNKEIILYSYSGFGKPDEININDLMITDNYLGDLTANFLEEYEEVIETYSLQEMQENQPLHTYSVWINPTRDQLEEYNKSVLLSKDDYLDNFVGHNKLSR